MIRRPRRLRTSHGMRELVREFKLDVTDLIYPLFIVEGTSIKCEIPSLPEVYHYSVDQVVSEIKVIKALGIRAVLLFGIPDTKDLMGTEAYSNDGIVQKAIRAIKNAEPEMIVITDVCMCQYTEHGHCGILDCNSYVDNDLTLEYLIKIAVSHAEAGADIVAPSDMMDGRIEAIRKGLDANKKINTAILSYSIKYASNLYGPFRDAAHSIPSFGDRKTYQMDYHNRREALLEAELDTVEGADMLMVKPASFYLDIISAIKKETHLPVVAYQVSGEYAMLYNAVKAGVINEQAIYEQLIAIKRAGADMVISYFSKYIAEKLEG